MTRRVWISTRSAVVHHYTTVSTRQGDSAA
jgi:hypothetical protein